MSKGEIYILINLGKQVIIMYWARAIIGSMNRGETCQ